MTGASAWSMPTSRIWRSPRLADVYGRHVERLLALTCVVAPGDYVLHECIRQEATATT
jgi:hypothetical protein